MEQTENDQRGGKSGIIMERRGRDQTKNMYEWPINIDDSVEIDCGHGGKDGMGRGGQREKLGQL